MPTYSHSFVSTKPHKSAYHINGFFSVTVREIILKPITGNLFPYTLIVFYISEIFYVNVRLTDIVKQRYYCRGFFGKVQLIQLLYPFPCKIIRKTVVHVYRVLRKSALIAAMKPRTGGSGKKIAAAQIIQQLVSAVSLDFFFIYFNKFFFYFACSSFFHINNRLSQWIRGISFRFPPC